MDLHAVVMHLDRPAFCIDAADQPLRARHQSSGYDDVLFEKT